MFLSFYLKRNFLFAFPFPPPQQQQDKLERMGNNKSSQKPEECSYKKPVSRIRTVVPPELGGFKKMRDPRFDTLSGFLDQNKLKQSYSFLKDYRSQEKEALLSGLQEESCSLKRQAIKSQLDRIKSQEQAEQRTEQLQRSKSERRKLEQELVAQGKKPFFLKRSEQKKEALIDKYYELKQKNPSFDVDKFTEKRHRKQASKQKTSLPYKNRSKYQHKE